QYNGGFPGGNLYRKSYTDLRNALVADANVSGDPNQITAFDNLPTSDPNNGGNTVYLIERAEAKALGFISPNNSDTDGWIGFNSNDLYSFAPGVVPPSSNEYYFVGVAEHEISEEMGRNGWVDTSFGLTSNVFSPMTLFRYYLTSNPVLYPTTAA